MPLPCCTYSRKRKRKEEEKKSLRARGSRDLPKDTQLLRDTSRSFLPSWLFVLLAQTTGDRSQAASPVASWSSDLPFPSSLQALIKVRSGFLLSHSPSCRVGVLSLKSSTVGASNPARSPHPPFTWTTDHVSFQISLEMGASTGAWEALAVHRTACSPAHAVLDGGQWGED